AARCFLPLSVDPNLSQAFGTRHRAAVGLTEETDAVAVVISEERGKISLVVEGKVTQDLEGPQLRSSLQRLFGT
ncbi:MAG: DNA integrity scanning protein DisA nucleotide-binding domain protein, partial [Candidatus Binatota bacterium]